MGHSDRTRHRDRAPGHRRLEEEEPRSLNRVFRITDAQRHEIAASLRYIDAARRDLETQQNPGNREIIRELRASADRIFDVLDELEPIS